MALIKEIDYGTPASKSEKQVTLYDRRRCGDGAGRHVHHARGDGDRAPQIPKLCATDMLESFGSCRLCLVEIEGRNGTPASCTTPVAPGIAVQTQTPRLAADPQGRDGTLHLGPSARLPDLRRPTATASCRTWPARSACATCATATRATTTSSPRRTAPPTTLWMAKDETNPYFTYDPSKCIVCNRCVRACEEVQGTFALTISGRGFDSRVSAGMNEDFLQSASACRAAPACRLAPPRR